MATNPFEGMNEQQLADLRKYAEWDANRKLSIGSPEGNPGYSYAAPTYNPQHYKVGSGVTGGGVKDPGGVRWVGPEGGDTPENRAKFDAWAAENARLRDQRFSQLPVAGAPQAPQAPQAPNPGLLAWLKSLFGKPSGASPVSTQPVGTAVPFQPTSNYIAPTYQDPSKKGLL